MNEITDNDFEQALQLANDMGRKQAAKECIAICDHLTALGYNHAVTSIVVYEIKNHFNIEAQPYNPDMMFACPDCGALAKENCKIDWNRNHVAKEADTATAKCTRCGYAVSVRTWKDIKIIRALWNTRRVI